MVSSKEKKEISKRYLKNAAIAAAGAFGVFLLLPVFFTDPAQKAQLAAQAQAAAGQDGALPVLTTDNPLTGYLKKAAAFYGFGKKRNAFNHAGGVLPPPPAANYTDEERQAFFEALASERFAALTAVGAGAVHGGGYFAQNGTPLLPDADGYFYGGSYYKNGTYPATSQKKSIEEAIKKFHEAQAAKEGKAAAYVVQKDGYLRVEYMPVEELAARQSGRSWHGDETGGSGYIYASNRGRGESRGGEGAQRAVGLFSGPRGGAGILTAKDASASAGRNMGDFYAAARLGALGSAGSGTPQPGAVDGGTPWQPGGATGPGRPGGGIGREEIMNFVSAIEPFKEELFPMPSWQTDPKYDSERFGQKPAIVDTGLIKYLQENFRVDLTSKMQSDNESKIISFDGTYETFKNIYDAFKKSENYSEFKGCVENFCDSSPEAIASMYAAFSLLPQNPLPQDPLLKSSQDPLLQSPQDPLFKVIVDTEDRELREKLHEEKLVPRFSSGESYPGYFNSLRAPFNNFAREEREGRREREERAPQTYEQVYFNGTGIGGILEQLNVDEEQRTALRKQYADLDNYKDEITANLNQIKQSGSNFPANRRPEVYFIYGAEGSNFYVANRRAPFYGPNEDWLPQSVESGGGSWRDPIYVKKNGAVFGTEVGVSLRKGNLPVVVYTGDKPAAIAGVPTINIPQSEMLDYKPQALRSILNKVYDVVAEDYTVYAKTGHSAQVEEHNRQQKKNAEQAVAAGAGNANKVATGNNPNKPAPAAKKEEEWRAPMAPPEGDPVKPANGYSYGINWPLTPSWPGSGLSQGGK
ncbi:MAG: hypothetical protein LBR90_03780 [Elusimicrobiota bacterium]|jgi:hypothetical protein|nr:hypothetical protein [Elusimicrobiota bacterium]